MTNHENEMLAHIEKIAAWADTQRKMSKWMMIFMATFIPLVVLIAVVAESRINNDTDEVEKPEAWSSVSRAVTKGDLEEAIRVGKIMLQKTPDYEYGHYRLAYIYLSAGNLEQSRHHFEEVYRIFPSEENKKGLEAINKRIKQETLDTNEPLQ